MSNSENKKQADWQKNAGRPSNFNEKDNKLRKDGEGNLKIKKDKGGVTDEEEETIHDTLDSLTERPGEDEEEQ
ncbi:MAG: hypothetical protein KJP01_04295 [Gramella sp.]|nr:hypothetical protein [Christiangramia sp.]